ncbi:MAG TPA: transglycosylase SLT domain-containing protein [Jatrophihabitans sp.]|jgi:cell wall-associated NlpC family hydrolase
MTTGIANIDQVLARIAQIQSVLPQFVNTAKTASTTSATSATDFASTLAGVGTDSSTATQPQSGSVTGNDIVASAKKYLGVPYVFGGTTASGLDCSGLVQKAYGDLGITLPRLSWDQAKTGTAVPDLAHAQPGDILGFGSPAEHVAIYLGNNMMIAAPQPGENVKIQSVYETPASIRRIVGTDAAGTAASTGSINAAPTSGATSAALAQYSALFAQNEKQQGLPSGLLAAVAQTESGGNAQAVSPAGAQGLMQLMPSTAAGLGVNPWDPAQAVQGASKLLGSYLHKYGSVPLALAAYNAGPGAVDQYGGVPPYTETQNYVKKITGLMAGGV